jgi:hypothetical protein
MAHAPNRELFACRKPSLQFWLTQRGLIEYHVTKQKDCDVCAPEINWCKVVDAIKTMFGPSDDQTANITITTQTSFCMRISATLCDKV